LVPGDTNGLWNNTDAFVRDRVSGTTTRVSISSSSVQGNSGSYPTAMSADGRFVVFSSWSDNLVSGDVNYSRDVFVRDRVNNTTKLSSVSSTGVLGNVESDHGSISADGRYVAFGSGADNLVQGDTNGQFDVFVHDRLLNNKLVADMGATMTIKPTAVKKGQTASYRLTIKNNGPNIANNLTLTNIVSNGTVVSVTPRQSSSICSSASLSICRMPSLAVGSSASFTVKIKANANPLKQQINVSAAPKDNVPNNNAIKITTTVTP
jgi:uncharacterized repeat protein (TIGR01451 family)